MVIFGVTGNVPVVLEAPVGLNVYVPPDCALVAVNVTALPLLHMEVGLALRPSVAKWLNVSV